MKDWLKRLSFDSMIFVIIGVLFALGVTTDLLPSQQGILRSIFLYSVALLHWYITRRLFIGRIDWFSEGDKWRKLLALVMLGGAYLVYSGA